MASTFGLAVWGLGNHARRNLLPAIVRASGWRLVGVHSRNRDVVRATAATFDVAAFESAEELLSSDAVDAVLIAGPNGVHTEQATRVLESGKHAFIEKSLACSLSDVQRLAELANSRRMVLAECFMYTYHQQFGRLSELVRSGRVGALRCVDAHFGFPHLAADDIRYSAALGGGALNDVGAYCISAALQLFDQTPKTVQSQLHRRDAQGVDTSGSALLSFADGATSCGEWGFGRSYANDLRLWFDDATVTAERAFSKPESLATSVVIRHQRGEVEELVIPPENHFIGMLSNFHHALSGSVDSRTLALQAVRQAAVLQRIRESAVAAPVVVTA